MRLPIRARKAACRISTRLGIDLVNVPVVSKQVAFLLYAESVSGQSQPNRAFELSTLAIVRGKNADW